MTYILDGTVTIGYEINKKKRSALCIGPGRVMGEYNVQFLRDSLHIYVCNEPLVGYSISRRAWKNITEDPENKSFEIFVSQITKRCLLNYMNEFIVPIFLAK